MKHFKLITLLTVCLSFSFFGCNDDSKKTEIAEPSNVETVKTTTSAKTAEAAQNEKGVWHYTCALGCPGGAGSAVPCKNCKNPLTHNQAYHGDASTTQQASPVLSPSATREPSQNTAGVWHYTCPNGCAGGSGSASKCTTCGETLAHNSAYH